MKMASLKLFLILTGLGSVFTISHSSHYGTSFDLGIIPMFHNYIPDITLDVASNASGHIGLYIPYLNINRTQSLNNGHTSINVENQLIRRGNYTERRGIHIKTDVPVAVYVTLYINAITESYLALPNTFTGKSYIAAAFEPYPGESSETLIVGSDFYTAVNITTASQLTSSVHLNWLDANQITSFEVTGTLISATGRVSVISGTACANVPYSYTYDCGFIVEQMIPTDAWEKEYIVPNMYPRNGVLIRVLSHKSHDVCFYTKRGPSCKQIPHPYPLEFSAGSEPVVVRSNSTISVMSYGIGGGPFMITVPGIKNFMNEYYFIVPPSYGSFRNSIAVVIQSSRLTGLTLDGSPIEPSQSYNVPQPYDNYRVLISSITSGYHTLSHQDMSVAFGAFLYGHGNDEGYGFPLGMQKETVSTTTTKAKVKTTLDSNICYYCDDMFHVELCDVVQRCSGSEICYLERFLKHGRQTFRSGCLSQEICSREYESASTEPDRCIECCFGSYCNNKGCGATGLPARDLRGPLCYDCEYTLSPDECDTLKLCDEGQVCRIEETKWGTNSNYLMGCARASCSPVKRSVHVSARSTRICQSCCSEDYCNLNCTVGTGHEQPDIVG